MFKLYFTGIDLRVWKQAQADNPNSAVFIPVPIVGFSELCRKYKCHNEQVTVHKLTLNSIAERLSELARKKTRVESKLEQYTDKMDLTFIFSLMYLCILILIFGILKYILRC